MVDSLRGTAVRRRAVLPSDRISRYSRRRSRGQGIVIKDRDTTIAMAHTVCAGLDKHYKSSVLAVKLVRDTDLSLKQSGYFIGVAISAYCPQYAGHTDTSANWLNPGPPLM